MKRILSTLMVFVMCFALCFTVNATDVPSTAKAVFTLSSESCKAGENVEIEISLTSSVIVNSIGLANFVYDAKALEFVGFSDFEESIKEQMVFNIEPDSAKMAITIPLKKAVNLDSKLCTMTFKVKESAAEGKYTVTATPLTKNGSDVAESFVVPAEIAVASTEGSASSPDEEIPEEPETIVPEDTEIEAPETEIEEIETGIFRDVSENDWFYENVMYVVENKLMNGVSEDEFAPANTLTRAMLVTVLYRNAGEPSIDDVVSFTDVDMSSWYANAVLWAKQNGIVNGVNDTEFAPDNNITREQIAAIMYRYAQYKGYDVAVGEETNILSYDDVESISEYAIAPMQYVVGSGLIKGKSDTTLNPKDNATRAEIAAILQRFIENNK